MSQGTYLPVLDRFHLKTVARAMKIRRPLEGVAAELEFSSVGDLLEATANALGIDVVDLDHVEVDGSLLDDFPIKLIHRFEVFPLRRKSDSLTLAVSNPFDIHAIDAISAETRAVVTPVLAESDQLRGLIKSHLGVGADTVDGLLALQKGDDQEVLQSLDGQDLEDAEQAQQASVVRLVNEILTAAIEIRASDIHVEAQERGLKLRYRIDGVLQKQPDRARDEPVPQRHCHAFKNHGQAEHRREAGATGWAHQASRQGPGSRHPRLYDSHAAWRRRRPCAC